MTRYNRYSHHARRALTHAGVLVRRFRHPRVDTGHLLVGVLLTYGSIGHSVLTELGLQAADAESVLEALTMPLEEAPESPRNDAALDIALELAADESSWLGHHYIGTEHLLLGITRTNIGNASDLLRQLGVPPDQVRRRIRSAVSDGVQEYSLEQVRRNARLSELSRRVINAAEQMAVMLDHPTVGIGHLLTVLTQEQRALAAELLARCDLDEKAVQQAVDRTREDALVSIEPVLLQAGEYAQQYGMHYTGTEHLLMGILANEAGQHLLRSCGVKPAQLHKLIVQEFGPHR